MPAGGALSQRRGLTLNPITTMYYIAPASFAFLSIPWFLIEAAPMLAASKVQPSAARLDLMCLDSSLSIRPPAVDARRGLPAQQMLPVLAYPRNPSCARRFPGMHACCGCDV